MYKSEVQGVGFISAKVVADSISEAGARITTFEIEYPRFIHAEFMTHRLLSRNAASSRAIPVSKAIERIREIPAKPVHWGKNQKGMQASEECNNKVSLGMFKTGGEEIVAVNYKVSAETAWNIAADQACNIAEEFDKAGYHKQIVNRLTEPFQFMKVVVTATEWSNFFALRLHKDAQPEIRELANVMKGAMLLSRPDPLKTGEWHVPYVESYRDFSGQLGYFVDGESISTEDAIKVSASCCAQVSYRALDQSLEKALKIYDALVSSKPVHASPFEHQAMAPKWDEFDLNLSSEDGPLLENMPEGFTHEDRLGRMWSGNFQGWIQYRQLLKDHTVW